MRNRMAQGGLTKQGMHELNEIRQTMIVAPMDKSSNDVMFVCKATYVKALKQEVLSPTCVQVTESDEDIWRRHAKKFSERFE